jgi:ribosomal protein L11 methyltransferase
VIDPGAAFGTGAHESTRLALEWIDALAADLPPDGVVLDIGAGTGVLAIAALALAPVRALALDLDPVAALATRDNARRNGLDERLGVFAGDLAALDPGARFSAIVANLLRRELEPLLSGISSRAEPEAPIVLSGLLEAERARIERLARACGLETHGLRSRRDASGETWIGLLMRPSGAANPR